LISTQIANEERQPTELKVYLSLEQKAYRYYCV